MAFLLRLFGDRLPADCFTELNKVQRSGLATTLQGDVGNSAWEQAQIGIDDAGLGMRNAEEVALLPEVMLINEGKKAPLAEVKIVDKHIR